MQNLTLHSILAPDLVTVELDTPLTEVLANMENLHIDCVVAIDDEHRPLGTFTLQDAIRLMAETRTTDQLKMADVMKVLPLIIASDMDCQSAYQLFSQRSLRHMVVVDPGGRLFGLLNESDLLHHLGADNLIDLQTVADMMKRDVQPLTTDATLADAVQLMTQQHNSCVIITRDQTTLGILTEHDIIPLMRSVDAPATVNITSVMKTPVQTVPASLPLKSAALKMEQSGLHHLVVMEQDRIAGIITHRGISRALRGRCADFVRQTLERQRRELDHARTMIEPPSQQLVLRSLMEQISDGIYIVDAASGNILDVNNKACDSLNYSRAELLRLSFVELLVRKQGVSWQGLLEQIAGSGQLIFEARLRRHDNSEFPAEINARLVQRNKHDYFIAVARDLTELHQQQHLLQLHDAALNASPSAIILTDKQAVIQWCNKAFSDMSGFAPEEAVGKQPRELISSGVQPPEFYQSLWHTILSGKVWHGEIVNKRKDGLFYEEEMTITPVRLDHGEVTHFIAIKQDISKRKQAEKAIHESHEQLHALIEAIPDAIFFKDGESRWLVTNEPAKQLFQLHDLDWQGKTEMELAAARPEYRTAHENCYTDDEKTWQAGKLMLFEEHIPDETGRLHQYEVRKVPVFGPARERKGLVIIGRDVSEQKQVEEQLREAAAVMKSTHEGVVICDTTPRIIAVNAAYTAITGFTAEEVIGRNPSVLSDGHPDASFHETMWKTLLQNGHWQGEVWNRRKNGELYPQLLTISTVYDEQQNPRRYVGVFADISQLKENQAQLEFMALHDPLTRLPNRSLVEQRLQQEIDHAHRLRQKLGVLFIDLDRFKLVNDSFGHLIGDELLCDVTARLAGRVREGDTLGRLGGDEFILVVSQLHNAQDAAVVARDFINVLSEPFKLPDGHEVFVSASIGISLYPQDGETVIELMKNADAAMYLAKDNGRNQYSYYSRELNADARIRLAMENDLRRAVLHNELMLHYQPIVDLHTGKICGAEALARWQRSKNRWISPTKFIPLSEKSGMILVIGNWVIDQVCKQIRSWLDQGLDNVRVAVNISARQFRSGNLDKLVAQALKKYRIDARHLELELTESMLMHEHEHAIETMEKLKQLGVKLSLDDFGTGYSSFSYLSRFPIDTLKIDQSFVQNVVIDRDATEIASAIIGLAHRIGLRVVAEGVETEAQLSYLRENGCDEIQGFRFSTPLPPQDFAALLRSGKTLPTTAQTYPTRSLLIICDELEVIKEIEFALRDEDYRIYSADNMHDGLEQLALHHSQIVMVKHHLPSIDAPDFLASAKEIEQHTFRILLASYYDDLATLSQTVNNSIADKLLSRPIGDEQLRKHILEAFLHQEMLDRPALPDNSEDKNT